MKNFGNKLKKLPWGYISLVLVTLLFFSFVTILTYDTGHYLGYVSIFEGNTPASEWDVVRGPIFPFIIFLFNTLFGKTNAGMLVGLFIFYLIFICICYKLIDEICENYKRKNLIRAIVFIVLTLNPLIFGYFHVLLTEFVAITMTMLNILVAYRWIFIKHNKKSIILYALFFFFSTIFCYHLKQSYIIIAIAPPLTAAIISIIKNHCWKNILYRFGTITMSGIILLFSIFIWNGILDKIGADRNTGRDSSSMLSRQLLMAYIINDDKDNNDYKKTPTTEAIGILLNQFSKNPLEFTGHFFQNYCGLTSICEITSPNTHDYYSTGNLAGLSLYENATIGYATFRRNSNIFPMDKEEMITRSSLYVASTSTEKPISLIMRRLETPTNLLFKIAFATYPFFFIFIVAIHHKDKKRKHSKLFYLCIILLSTTAAHMILSAGVGFIIDRYAIEAFTPALLGIFGSITYSILVLKPSIRKKKNA